jgi:hypothetical protein
MNHVLTRCRTMALYAALLVFGCSRAEQEPMPVDIAGLSPEDSTAAIQVVVRFGERLQRVSVTAPDSIAREAIRSEYGDLVSPALMEGWLQNPAGAPGRETSSPWPDRIEIISAELVQTGESTPPLAVQGNIVERTSADPPDGASGRIPVRITVARQGGEWRIVEVLRTVQTGAPTR